MLQITELYRNIFRFFADEEASFYEADALDAGNPRKDYYRHGRMIRLHGYLLRTLQGRVR